MKTVVFLFLCVLGINCFAQVETVKYLEIGCEDFRLRIAESYYRTPSVTYNMKAGGEFKWKGITAGGYVNSNFTNFSLSKRSFSVLFVEYDAYARYRYGSIEVGVEHLCMHPLVAQMKFTPVFRSFEKIYLKVYL